MLTKTEQICRVALKDEYLPRLISDRSNSSPMETSIPKINSRVETDTVILEVRRVKQELMKRDNYDIATMVRNARACQAQSGQKIVDRSKPKTA